MTCEHVRTHKNLGLKLAAAASRSVPIGFKSMLAAVVALGVTGAAAETPKRGGTLTYMIPADAPPSFDGHRETTYATVHAAAPFYSVLIRVNPDNPASTTDFVCDLCTEMPKPTDDGKTYTFKIREGVKFHDGSPLTAADVAASWQHDRLSRRRASPARAQSYFVMVDKVEAPDDDDRRVPAEIRHHRVPAGARRPLRLHLQEGDPRQGPALVREEHHGLGPVQVRRLRDRPVDQGRAQPRLLPQGPALSRRLRRRSSRPSRRCASTRSAPTAPRSSSAACRRRRATSWSRSSATRSRCRRATGTAATWSRPTTRRSRSTTCGCAAR